MYRYIKLTMLAAAVVASGNAVYAANALDNDAGAVLNAKISLNQAVIAAEQHANGKAARAEFEPSKQHGWVYDVEVVSGAKVFDVKVDADKGTIIATTEDTSDRDEHDEKD